MHDREIVTRCDDSVAMVIGGRARRVPPFARATCRGPCGSRARCRGPCSAPARCSRTRSASPPDATPGSGRISAISRISRRSTRTARHRSRLERFLQMTAGGGRARPAPRLPLDRATRARGRASRRSPCSTTTRTSPALHGGARRSSGPVIGVAFDGTGYGTDGDRVGRRDPVAGYGEFTRFATCRPVPLAGGDLAIRQAVARCARAARRRVRGRPAARAQLPLFAAHAGERDRASSGG